MKTDPRFFNLSIIDHPLVGHKLTLIRCPETSAKSSRRLLYEIGLLMGHDVTADLPLTRFPLETRTSLVQAPVLTGRKPAVIAIVRGGLPLADGLLELMPAAHVGHIVIEHDANRMPRALMVKIPDIENRHFYICDAMMATGNAAVTAVNHLKMLGVPETAITFVTLLTTPEAMELFEMNHPGVRVFAASLEEHLLTSDDLLHGLGQTEDRIFGTL